MLAAKKVYEDNLLEYTRTKNIAYKKVADEALSRMNKMALDREKDKLVAAEMRMPITQPYFIDWRYYAIVILGVVALATRA
jgi:hypothetical protein